MANTSSFNIEDINKNSIKHINQDIKKLQSYLYQMDQFKEFLEYINLSTYDIKLDFSDKYPILISKIRITKELKVFNKIFKTYNIGSRFIRLVPNKSQKNTFYITTDLYYHTFSEEFYGSLMNGILEYIGIEEPEMSLILTAHKTDKRFTKTVNQHKAKLKKITDLHNVVHYINDGSYNIKVDFSSTYSPFIFFMLDQVQDTNDLNTIFKKYICNGKHVFITQRGLIQTQWNGSSGYSQISPLHYKNLATGLCEFLSIDIDTVPNLYP